MKRPISKAILAASYNYDNTKAEADRAILNQVEAEQRAGNQFLNHLYKCNLEEKGRTKFLNPTYLGTDYKARVPLFIHQLNKMYNSPLKEVAVVGDDNIGMLCDSLRAFRTKANLATDIRVTFVHQGYYDELSRKNTVEKGANALDPCLGENILEISGDTPEIDITKILVDPRNLVSDYVLAFNNRKTAGDYFPRNWHMQLIEDNTFLMQALLWLMPGWTSEKNGMKEHPIQIMDYVKIKESRSGTRIFDVFYTSRKGYGQKRSIFNAATDVCLYDHAGNLTPLNGLKTLARGGTGPILEVLATVLGRRMGFKLKPSIPMSVLPRLAKTVFGDGFKVNAYFFDQPGGIIDIDSRQDFIFYQTMLQDHPEIKADLNELACFAKYIGPKSGIEMIDHWDDIANQEFRKYNIDAQYIANGQLIQNVFGKERTDAQAKRLM